MNKLEIGNKNCTCCITVIGEVVQAYSEEKYLTNKIPDLKKINPILFSMYEFNYYKVGDKIGRAWDAGRNFKL